MIQAIVFDCFGVLVSDGWLPFKNKHFAADPALFNQASNLNKKTDGGEASFDDFIRDVARLAHVSAEEAKREIEHNPSDAELLEYITTLKPRFKIGMLSNAGDDWLEELLTPQQLGLFDKVALSFRTGAVKPESNAYHGIADMLGVDIKHCVLIDDQKRYCDGAIQAGMQAIVYSGLDNLKTDLQALLSSQSE